MKRRQGDELAEPAQADEETAGDDDEPGGRGAVVVVVVVGMVVAWRIIVVFPEVALVGGGCLGTLGWQRARAWKESRRRGGDLEAEESAPPDVGEALRRLVGDDKGVLLTVLRDDLGLPDTKAVKALLEAEDIPWKASRTRKGNGPAVRKEAIPPAPSPVTGHTHGDGCCCRSGDNNNSNNGRGGRAGEGFRVDRTDTGFTIHDLGRRASTGQGDADDDVIARFLAEVARTQAKPPDPPTT